MVLEVVTAAAAGHDLGARLRWMEIQAKLIDPQIAGHRGSILRAANDAVVAVFESPLDAARCAVELQHDISAANAATVGQAQIGLRIALDLCKSAAPEEDQEHALTAAAQMLGKHPEPGGIIVTATYRALVQGALDVTIESLEPTAGTEAAPGIACARVLVPQLGLPPSNRHAARHQPAVAVLPFATSPEAPVEEYLTGGIAQNIIGMLARVSDLVVLSRESTSMFRGGGFDPKAVGRQLGVRYLVTGQVRHDVERIELSPQLIDAETYAELWRDRYEVSLASLFDLQEDIARHIVGALLPNLSGAELKRAEAKRPENLNAYDLVLRAMHRMYGLNREDFAAAHALLEQAIQLDPGYAGACTLLAMWHKMNIGQGYCANENIEIAELMRAAAKATTLDPMDAHALALLGHCRAWLFRDYDEALDYFERAFAAVPNSAFAWGWSSPVCSYLGDGATAVAHAEHALRLCPMGPEAYFFRTALALAHYTSGNFEEAARWGRRSMAVNPHYEANLRFLAASLAASGRTEEARMAGLSLLAVRPNFSVTRVASRYAYKAKERNREFAEHLRLAGLPD